MDDDMTTRSIRQQDFADLRAGLVQFGGGAVLLALRALALLVYVVLAMAEPFIGIVLSVLAFGTFAVTVLFGFILQMPFPHRWEMLFASVGFMLLYGAYLGLLSWLQRFCRAD
jgi:hypothetical protein